MLLARGRPVRVVLRSGRGVHDWKSGGAGCAHADARDLAALIAAFIGARVVYGLAPRTADSPPGLHAGAMT